MGAPVVTIGVIGGSGLYEVDGLQDVREVRVQTPFGDPSDALIVGRLGDAEVVFLPRHGRGHVFLPTEVPYRANIHALKQLGCSWVLSVSAVGSLREEIVPGHVVLPDQFLDRTRDRVSTFFGQGCVAHVGFGDPVCGVARGLLREAAEEAGAIVHDGGTYVCMEGPAFSTRAESNAYRATGASVIGMTNLPEAKLAREAELSYATLALATDYDCWRDGHDAVTVDQVIAVMHKNVALARRVIAGFVPRVAAYGQPAPATGALRHAIMTAPDRIPPETRARLALLIGRYVD
jgi:5'-methylthioadenosine phosphorylase